MNKSQEPSRLQEGSWSLWGRFLTAPSSQDACFSEVAYAIIATPEICRLHFGFRALVPQAGDLNYCRALRLGQRRYRLQVKQPHHPGILLIDGVDTLLDGTGVFIHLGQLRGNHTQILPEVYTLGLRKGFKIKSLTHDDSFLQALVLLYAAIPVSSNVRIIFCRPNYIRILRLQIIIISLHNDYNIGMIKTC